MQRHKRVSIIPVAAGLAVPVNDGDVRISLSQQRVGKGQADSARADDEVVGFDVVHIASSFIK